MREAYNFRLSENERRDIDDLAATLGTTATGAIRVAVDMARAATAALGRHEHTATKRTRNTKPGRGNDQALATVTGTI